MQSVNLYLRRSVKPSVFTLRRWLAVCAFLAILALLSVVISGYRAAYADGGGLAPPSSAPSSVSPRIQGPNDPSTGVYTGCQLLGPVPDLPQSSR